MPTMEEKVVLEKKNDDLELSDDELDGVAGGAFIEPTIVRQSKPTVGFDDPIVGKSSSTGFENPVIATGLPTIGK